MAKILLLNGPNLNLLGTREKQTYGSETLSSVEQRLIQQTTQAGHELVTFQSNSEAALIDTIHNSPTQMIAWILFNPAAFTHTSIALRDALLGVDIPFSEIHISNPQAREDFRQVSYFSDIATGMVSGFGTLGYDLALAGAFGKLASLD